MSEKCCFEIAAVMLLQEAWCCTSAGIADVRVGAGLQGDGAAGTEDFFFLSSCVGWRAVRASSGTPEECGLKNM